jgi:hypothetical protein
MASTVRLPRSFVGDKAAPLDDFFQSTAHALMRGDPSKQESVARICERIKKELSARVIIDVGGLMRLKRSKMLELLAGIDKDLEYWVEYLEDVLDFQFPTPTAVETFRDPAAPPPSAALVPLTSSYRVATYRTEKTAKKPGLGAQLQAEGKLDRIIFSYAMFTQLVTQNPKEETLTQPEVEHINDTVWEFTFQKFGEVHVDIIYRKHCGRQLRLLFPNLPTYGGKQGDDRMFEEMLKWRFQNPRKTQAPGKKMYKPNLKVDRINLCEAAIELIEEKNFPITVLNEGKLETKFSWSLDDTDSLPPSGQGSSPGDGTAATVPYFGNAHPAAVAPNDLPPMDKVRGPLAPFPASAANIAANKVPVESHKKRMADDAPAPQKANKKPKVALLPPRTEPVYARRTEALLATRHTHTALCALTPLHRWRCSKSRTCLSRHCHSGRSRRTTRWWSAYPTRTTTASSSQSTGTAS